MKKCIFAALFILSAYSKASEILTIPQVNEMYKNIQACQKILLNIGKTYKCEQNKDSVIVFNEDGTIMHTMDILFAKNPATIKKIDGSDKKDISVSVINEEQNQVVFKRFKNMRGLKSIDRLENCAGRARMIAETLQKEVGIKVGFLRVSEGLFGKFDVQFPEDKQRTKVPFKYHVAPFIYVKNAAGKDEIRIIDPLFDRERNLTKEEWLNRLSSDPSRNSIEIRSTPL